MRTPRSLTYKQRKSEREEREAHPAVLMRHAGGAWVKVQQCAAVRSSVQYRVAVCSSVQ
jgi:hypothetical protein